MFRRGFTLVEILISAGIGMLMIALVSGALLSLRRLSDFNQALLGLHEDAAAIHRIVGDDAGATCHNASVTCEADPGTDGTWGSGDEVLTLTWMAALSDPENVGFGFAASPRHDLAWCRLRWEAASGRLSYARSSPFRVAKRGNVSIHSDPLLRRDRRRDLDDNDLRYLPGLSPADYAAIAMPGDRTDLDRNLTALCSPQTVLIDASFAWVDRQGWTVRADGSAGIVRRDHSGSVTPWSGGPFDQATLHAVDGAFLDARPHTATGAGRPVHAMRPVLLRISGRLVHQGLPSRHPITLDLDLTLPLGTELSLP